MHKEKMPYTITVKMLLTTLLVFGVLGLITGFIAARFEVRAFLKKNPQSRIVQTIEKQSQATSSYTSVIDSEKGKVVGILNEKNSVTAIGTVLTADGIFITPYLPNPKNSVTVLSPDGKIVSALLVRVYPEKGVSFYRADGSYSAPQFPSSETISPGAEGIIIGLVNNSSHLSVFPAVVQRFSAEESLDGVIFRERQAKLVFAPSSDFDGSPMFDQQNNLVGVVANTEKGLVLPVSEINLLLQDYLKHRAGVVVGLFDGLTGSWKLQSSEDKRMNAVFEIDSIAKNSVFGKAGLETGDVIYGVDDKNFPTTQLWNTFLEGARSSKPVTLSITRGTQTLKIPVTITIQNVTES